MPTATAVTPQILDPLLPDDFFERLAAHMDELVAAGAALPLNDSVFKRHWVHNDPFHVALHEVLVPLAGELAGTQVKKSYAGAAMYGEGGICPPHVDRPQCQYTIDLCVSQREPWGLFVDDVEYLLEPNQALFFSGTDSPHHRKQIQPGNHCNLVFFHFVNEDFEGSLD
jgi:hypothetical protein